MPVWVTRRGLDGPYTRGPRSATLVRRGLGDRSTRVLKKLGSRRAAATLATLALVPLASYSRRHRRRTPSWTTLSNTTPITINDDANATPYPSPITVSGLSGDIQSVTVTLRVCPTVSRGRRSRPGGAEQRRPAAHGRCWIRGRRDVGLQRDSHHHRFRSAQMSSTAVPTTGSYKPTNFFNGGDSFPPPGPGLAYGNPGPGGGARPRSHRPSRATPPTARGTSSSATSRAATPERSVVDGR